jgi:DNA-directed RNA polymerase specialized sigma subunit
MARVERSQLIVGQAKDELRSRLGREPTDDEVQGWLFEYVSRRDKPKRAR